jgi:RHS repeat-associated protein
LESHLGTPIAKFKSSTFDWRGGFEPFGADWNGAQAAGVFLRFPGQWLDEAWKDASLGAEVYYNVHRWYEHGVGRYGRVDPLGRMGDPNPFVYVRSRPTFFVDPLGLVTDKKDCACCSPEQRQREHWQIGVWGLDNWPKYAWTPAHAARGGSCLGAADRMQRDLERFVAPKCYITSVQLVKGPFADLVESVCGVYFPVHYVVKLVPCDGKGPDWRLDGYSGPNYKPLPPEDQIDEP